MSRFRTAMLGTAAAAMCSLTLSPALSQSSDPSWLDDLGLQLQTELQCAVNYYLNMQEGQLGANRYYEARVQCVDGRMFDASRTEPDETFTIRPCVIAVC